MTQKYLVRTNKLEIHKSSEGFAIGISSGAEEDEPHIYARAFGLWFWLRIPPIIPAYREKVKAEYWDAATIAKQGRDWYWDFDPREYSISVSDGFLNIHYGRQNNEGSKSKNWGYFLPWTQWRFVSRTFFDKDNTIHSVLRAPDNSHCKHENAAPKRIFAFTDFDGEAIHALVSISEWRSKWGEKWCSWLSHFRRDHVTKNADITFTKEVGP